MTASLSWIIDISKLMIIQVNDHCPTSGGRSQLQHLFWPGEPVQGDLPQESVKDVKLIFWKERDLPQESVKDVKLIFWKEFPQGWNCDSSKLPHWGGCVHCGKDSSIINDHMSHMITSWNKWRRWTRWREPRCQPGSPTPSTTSSLILETMDFHKNMFATGNSKNWYIARQKKQVHLLNGWLVDFHSQCFQYGV